MSQTNHSPDSPGQIVPSEDVTVADIFSMSDGQLIEFMKKHWKSDNSISLPVNDFGALSEDELGRLSQRLLFVFISLSLSLSPPLSVQHAMLEDPSANSRPLDLSKLDSLLHAVASGQDSFARDGSCTSERETPPPLAVDPNVRSETAAYNHLVNDGGRPLYSIDVLETVTKDPYAHQELLKPYARPFLSYVSSYVDGIDYSNIAQMQWHRWQKFRKWQLDNRGIDDQAQFQEDSFQAFVEGLKDAWLGAWPDKAAAGIEAGIVDFKEPGGIWHRIQRDRNWQRRYQREPECMGFLDYEKALTIRLARHGFTQLFRLADDPKQQDKLTTWIEYLGFEYWWLDRYTTSFERKRHRYFNDWEEQRKLGLFEKEETPESVLTKAGNAHLQARFDQAGIHVREIQSEVRKLEEIFEEDPDRISTSREQCMEMMEEARQRLEAARKAHLQLKRAFGHFFDKTSYYPRAKRNVACQQNLVNWVVKQVPVIEAEQKSSMALSETQTQSSADVAARDVGRPGIPGEHDMNPSQSAAQVRARAHKPSSGVAADLETGRGSTHKKRKATTEIEDLVQSRLKRRALNSASTRASRQQVRAMADANQVDGHDGHEAQRTYDTDPISQSSQTTAIRGLRRSSRLAALAPKAEVPSRHNKSVGGSARARAVAPASALGSDFVPVEEVVGQAHSQAGTRTHYRVPSPI
ncbi:hypothetical protein E4U43_007578 [Claviceps pusilla]|uniref:Uncharacterized protein n=1 Tax=Claviceps pusilla TaxID=123648 RepID=A0A9P7NEP1_9HYPO|nr:hypothetical protein E4U43_007578 [Claviceps pusilla]